MRKIISDFKKAGFVVKEEYDDVVILTSAKFKARLTCNLRSRSVILDCEDIPEEDMKPIISTDTQK